MSFANGSASRLAPRALVLWLSLAALGGTCGSNPPPETLPPPPSVPTEAVELEGDGDTIAGRVGPPGGTLTHSDNGARLEIPAGVVADEGLDVAFRFSTGALDPSDTLAPIGPVMTFSPPLEPSGAEELTLSIPLAADAVPDGFDEADLRLAVEKPGDVGPSDGASSPATTWEYLDTELDEGRATSRLPELTGMRMQFVFRTEGPEAPEAPEAPAGQEGP